MVSEKTMNTEEWRPVKGWENLYEVSNLGNVRTCKHVVTVQRSNTKSFSYTIPPKQKKLGSCNTGYLTAALSKNGKTVNVQVHTMVAEAFIPNPNNFKLVNHIDNNGHNNCVQNLEWCTYKGNNIHCVYNGHQSQSIPVICIEENKSFPSLSECDRYYNLVLGTTSKYIKSTDAEPKTGFILSS